MKSLSALALFAVLLGLPTAAFALRHEALLRSVVTRPIPYGQGIRWPNLAAPNGNIPCKPIGNLLSSHLYTKHLGDYRIVVAVMLLLLPHGGVFEGRHAATIGTSR